MFESAEEVNLFKLKYELDEEILWKYELGNYHKV